MALTGISSAFTAGAGKVKSINKMVYNSDVSGSEYVALVGAKLIADADKGFAIGESGQVVTSIAVAATTAGSSDAALVSQGYVATQLAAAAGISKQIFVVDSASDLATGKAVCLSTGTNAPLALAAKSGDALSNAFGIITSINGLNVTVQLDAQVIIAQDISLLAVGTPLFVGAAGALVEYSSLATGDWATLVGYVSASGTMAGDGKIVIVPRAWGQV